MEKRIFINILMSIFTLSSASSCDGVSDEIYNCNGFSVKKLSARDVLIPEGTYVTERAGGPLPETNFVYPDGSVHIAKSVSYSDAWKIEGEIGTSGNHDRVHAICRSYGPGVVLVN